MRANNGYIFIIILFLGFFLGGILFWIIKGFKTPFKSEFEDKNIRRNIFAALIIFGLYYLFSQSKYFEPKEVITEPVKFDVIYEKNGKIKFINSNGDELFKSKDTTINNR